MVGLTEMAEAREQYDDAWSFWSGTRDEEFSSPAVQRALRRSAGRYVVNVAKAPVRALSSRLKISALVALDQAGTKDDPADEALQHLLQAQRMTAVWKRLIRKTCIYGDSYLFIWAGETDGTCVIKYNSPLGARVIYDEEDDTVPLYGIKQWQDRAGQRRATLYYADHLEPGWYVGGDSAESARDWKREPGVEDIPNPFGRIPLFHFRTDTPYGIPVSMDAWGSQDALNKISTTLVHTTEAAGFPERYALTDPAAALTGDAGDAPDWDDDADADVVTEDDSRLRGGPGEINLLAGIKGVGEWSAGNAQAFLDPADFYIRAIALVTGTPLRYMDQRGSTPSGEALRVADAPLMANIEDMQETLDADVAAAMQFALTILGHPDSQVDVRWKSPGIVDDQTTWAIVIQKIAAGVPAVRALSETGLYDADEVESWMAESSVEMDVGRRITLLAQFAAAVAQLDQAKALGTLDATQVDAVLGTTIGQLTPELESADGAVA